MGLGSPDSSEPRAFPSATRENPLSGPLGCWVPMPCPASSLPKYSAPPPILPMRAQGLVSLRATGREVFDWILDQGYYSERDTSNVVRQVLEAVAYLHSLKIVHRNLKVRPGARSVGTQFGAELGSTLGFWSSL